MSGLTSPPEKQVPNRPAPLLLLCGLLIWGWQNEFLLLSLLPGVVLEIAPLLGWRWQITRQDFNRVCNLSWIILLFMLAHQLNKYGGLGIFHWLRLLPLLLFPVLLTQCYSEQGRIRLSSLFFSLRRLERHHPELDYGSIDLRYLYVLMCLITAAMGTQRTPIFFFLCCLLTIWALWPLRSRNDALFRWSAIITAALLLALGIRAGMLAIHGVVQPSFAAWVDDLFSKNRDPNIAKTALGSLTRFKLSDRILLRVDPQGTELPPTLLREAAYNRFSYGNWQVEQAGFEALDPQATPAGKAWILQSDAPQETARELDISIRFRANQAIIPVPHGILQVRGAGLISLESNLYDSLKLEVRPGWIHYRTLDQSARILGERPGAAELSVPAHYRQILQPLVTELRLQELSPEQAIAAVSKHFQGFSYRLRRRHHTGARSKLEDFLYHDRSGHCEYFATATALLLRQADIPTRYAIGYVVREYSDLEKRYIARARHAHSWVLAYLDGQWRIVDTTPPIWWPLEQHESAIQSVLDVISLLSYWFSAEPLRKDSEIINQLLYWLLIPLCVMLAWSLLRRPRISRTLPGSAKLSTERGEVAGGDSEFYRVIELLAQAAPPRQPAQTLAHWIHERKKQYAAMEQSSLQALLELHYRYRFDPDGLDASERIQLHRRSRDWLKDTPLDPPTTPRNAK